MSASDFTARDLEIMRARSGGHCEGCGLYARTEAHHRLYRSRGGSSGAANGLMLCGLGNTSGCHGSAHTRFGEELGWSVKSGFDPAVVPVRLAAWPGRVLLTADGRVLAADDHSCWSHESPIADCNVCVVAGAVVWSFEDWKGWDR